MLNYRNNYTYNRKVIYNPVTGENKVVFAYDDFNMDNSNASAYYGMYLYSDDSNIYVFDKFIGIYAISISEYNNIKYTIRESYFTK